MFPRGLGFKPGNHIEQFGINGHLSLVVKLALQIFQHLIDIFLSALHGRQTAGIFTGHGLCTGTEEHDEKP